MLDQNLHLNITTRGFGYMVKFEKHWWELNEIMQIKACHSAWHTIGATHMDYRGLLLHRKEGWTGPNSATSSLCDLKLVTWLHRASVFPCPVYLRRLFAWVSSDKTCGKVLYKLKRPKCGHGCLGQSGDRVTCKILEIREGLEQGWGS